MQLMLVDTDGKLHVEKYGQIRQIYLDPQDPQVPMCENFFSALGRLLSHKLVQQSFDIFTKDEVKYDLLLFHRH